MIFWSICIAISRNAPSFCLTVASIDFMSFHDQNRPLRRCRFIGLGSASTGHWPINRRCANKLCAYGVLPILVGKTHLLSCNIVPNPQRLCIIDQFAARGQCRLGRGDRATIAAPDTRKECHYIWAVSSMKCSGTPRGYQDNSQALAGTRIIHT